MENQTTATQETPEVAVDQNQSATLMAGSESPQPLTEAAAPETKPEVEAPASDSKEAGSKEAESTETQEIEIKLPEDSFLDEGAVESIAAFAKERGLTKQQAQEILDRQNEAVKAYVEKSNLQVKQVSESWKQLTLKDKEIGGEKFKENVQIAHEAVKRFASEDFIKALNETGFGNHPEVVRVFMRIGQAMREDRLVVPNSQGQGRSRDIASRLYGNPNQQ